MFDLTIKQYWNRTGVCAIDTGKMMQKASIGAKSNHNSPVLEKKVEHTNWEWYFNMTLCAMSSGKNGLLRNKIYFVRSAFSIDCFLIVQKVRKVFHADAHNVTKSPGSDQTPHILCGVWSDPVLFVPPWAGFSQMMSHSERYGSLRTQ